MPASGSRRWRAAVVVAYIGVVGAAYVGLTEVAHRQEADCRQTNDTNRVVRQLVDEALAPSGAAAVDLSRVAGFDQLDTRTQAYLVALGAQLAAGAEGAPDDGVTTTRERLRQFADSLPIRDC